MDEYTLKLPNAKTFDALDHIIQHGPGPSTRVLATVIRDRADAVIVLSKIVVASNRGLTATRETDDVSGEPG